MATCSGDQKLSRPIERCHAMSHSIPSSVAVVAATAIQIGHESTAARGTGSARAARGMVVSRVDTVGIIPESGIMSVIDYARSRVKGLLEVLRREERERARYISAPPSGDPAAAAQVPAFHLLYVVVKKVVSAVRRAVL